MAVHFALDDWAVLCGTPHWASSTEIPAKVSCRSCETLMAPVTVQPSDPIHSPAHYRWLPVEAIEITELFNFRLGNALKYILRADHKGKPIEDLEKALWYLSREIEKRKAKSEGSASDAL